MVRLLEPVPTVRDVVLVAARPPGRTAAEISAKVNAVVAICVLLSLSTAVGAVGVPVNPGDAIFALSANAFAMSTYAFAMNAVVAT